MPHENSTAAERVPESMHIYQRTVDGDSQDSLSIIARLIQPGESLLDLGMGAGGLGRYISQRQPLVADGITLNPAEADLARAWYRQAWVADLDQTDLLALIGEHRYNVIVCADVLEHLKAPEKVLAQCKTLLKPGGRMITSVPNAGYCGLVAELIQGDFRYRSEGLLDSTHLRFFTRRSLTRFFDDNGWATASVVTTRRELVESEFKAGFDQLPPAVARHLLALPDALTYQFVSVLQPGDAASRGLCVAQPEGAASALFSAQLYLAIDGSFDETTKLVTTGQIGSAHQTLRFSIPVSQVPYSRIRLDPADRPGFFRLHELRIRLPNGHIVWQWQAEQDSLVTLSQGAHQQILFSTPWAMAAGALLLLHGDDPWLELPLSADVLTQVTANGAELNINAGWPMSADYLQASVSINAAVSQLETSHNASSARLQEEVRRVTRQEELSETARLLNETERLALANQLEDRLIQLTVQQAQLAEQNAQLEALESAAMAAQNKGLQLTEALEHAQKDQQRLNDALQSSQTEKQQLMGELRVAQRERNFHLGQFNQVAAHLDSVERSRLFRATRPIAHMKERLDRMMGKAPLHSALAAPITKPLPIEPSIHPVDIIVPVYRGLEDTQRCLESVLVAPGRTAWRLIVINDCSPEPEVTDWLREFATRDARITLLENAENLGFVATVNRGMSLSADNDVLLLNSDTEVTNDWLDRIRRAAHSTPRVASVTPFSNNATICSYPRFCQPNELPVGFDTASLDRLFATHLEGQTAEVPTGVGFCMYIRRACLDDVGLFDVANFGKGYGEENDFCIRAMEAGWVNLHALDTFVRHAGGISFGDSKSERELQAMQTLRRLHPGYESDVHAYLQSDPAGPARLSVDIARITASGRPVILNVMHDREGGTLRHARELAHALGNVATFLRLAPAPGGVDLRLEGPHEGLHLHFEMPEERNRLLEILRALQISHIHFHHLASHDSSMCDLPGQLGVTHDFTTHDFHTYCPQISLTDHTDHYCGEKGIEQCRQCVQRNPAPGGESIDSWRARHGRLLSQARFVIAPSADTAERIQRFVPTAAVRVVPHATLDAHPVALPAPRPRVLPASEPLRVVVLGALSRIKGADVLEEVATLAASNNISLEFHLLGFAYRNLRTEPKAHLKVHGAYEEKDLSQLLKSLQADVAWFPALWPETYSYTLSAALKAGLPIIAPNVGAFGERLQNRDWTWMCDWRQSSNVWLEFFKHVRGDHFVTGISPPPIAAVSHSLDGEGAPIGYRTNYLESLPKPRALSAAQLLDVRVLLSTSLQQNHPQTATSFSSVKAATLSAVVRLRSHSSLSPLAKLIPMHLQRRVKSWLAR
jgi:O-antigen biosynthesis protein